MTQITHAARKKTIISQTSLESCILLPCVLYLHRRRNANMNKTAAGLGSLQMEDVTVPQPLLLGQVLITTLQHGCELPNKKNPIKFTSDDFNQSQNQVKKNSSRTTKISARNFWCLGEG